FRAGAARARCAAHAGSGRKVTGAVSPQSRSGNTRMNRPAESVSLKHERRSDVWLQTTAGIVGVLLLVQFLTGVLLAFYYVPSVDHAHTTVSYVEKVVSSGSWLRSLHHYGSQWLALFA